MCQAFFRFEDFQARAPQMAQALRPGLVPVPISVFVAIPVSCFSCQFSCCFFGGHCSLLVFLFLVIQFGWPLSSSTVLDVLFQPLGQTQMLQRVIVYDSRSSSGMSNVSLLWRLEHAGKCNIHEGSDPAKYIPRHSFNFMCIYIYIYIYIYRRLGGESSREIVSFRSCVRTRGLLG